MSWSDEAAVRSLWNAFDRDAPSGDLVRLFQRHLRAAYEAGRRDEHEHVCGMLRQRIAQLTAESEERNADQRS